MRKNKKGQRVPANSSKIERLRDEAERAARSQPFFPFSKVRIRCIFRAPNNCRRDTFNLAPSFKAAIDGIVRAGVIKDDNDNIVVEVSVMRGENLPKIKNGQLILEVIEVSS
jgi:crossover junction endodeoxyribonuclease RusA